MSDAVLPRSRRRSFKKRPPVRLIALICAGVAVLAALAVWGIGAYKHAKLLKEYPLYYKQKIVDNAREFELNPWHVAAVVRCESSFDAKATSNAGAMGLMQIMPETGQWLAGKFDEDDGFDPQTLYDPDINLKYGCWYLNWLMNRFDGDITLTTAAYHAGQGTVDNWLSDSAVSPDGKTIDPDSIPYASTRTYVKRVLTACERYEELYDYDT